MHDVIDWDLETHPFGPGNLAPKPVCVSIFGDGIKGVFSTADPDFDAVIEFCLDRYSVNQNIAFDMGVIMAWRPQFAEKIFKAYAEDRVTDLAIREKLLVLADTGQIEFLEAPDKTHSKLRYRQVDLEKKWIGIDRTKEKEEDDAWRFNYAALDGLPSSEYPAEALKYSQDDAENGYRIWECQEAHKAAFSTQHFHTRAAFSLFLQSCWGIAVDVAMVEAMTKEANERYAEKNFQKMLDLGILRPSESARPHARHVEKALALLGLKDPPQNGQWQDYRQQLEKSGIKFTGGKASSICMERLHATIKEVCVANSLPIPTTDKDNVSFDEEVQKEIGSLHPALEEFCIRNDLQKLVTTDLPRIRNHPIIHPKYDVLKTTGRCSSYGDKKGDPGPYPAMSVHQVHPLVRPCMIPREGWVFCSVDFDFLELVTVAQKCLDLFGTSVLADKINAGIDPHAYLGAQLCNDYDKPFHDSLVQAGLNKSPEDMYSAFLRMKDVVDETRYSHYRTFAKPTGLGLWGGLGAETFVTYAKTQYNVDLVKLAGGSMEAIDMAKAVKQTWIRTFPEAQTYFNWISRDCVDLDWCGADGDRYSYVSPLGMIRRNCLFTEAANGAGLQTPAAEGAKQALWDLTLACYDRSADSPLLGCRPVVFLHDQIIAEIPIDDWTHERAFEMARIMQEGMKRIVTKVRVGAKPVLMLRWDKAAKTVIENDRLQIWRPKAKAIA